MKLFKSMIQKFSFKRKMGEGSLGSRLMKVCYLTIVLGVILLGTSLVKARLDREVSAKYQQAIARVTAVDDVDSDFKALTIAVMSASSAPGENQRWGDLKDAKSSLGDSLAEAIKSSYDADTDKSINEVSELFNNKVVPVLSDLEALAKKGNGSEVPKLFAFRFQPLRTSIEALILKAKTATLQEGAKFYKQQQSGSYDQYAGYFMLGALILGIGIITGYSRRLAVLLSKALEEIASEVSEVSLTIGSLSRQTEAVSSKFSSSSAESASAITETLAVTESGKKEGQRGQEVATKMVASFDEIRKANARLESIVKIISDIKAKTKIINDIAFETKLLSFNASIEAARAGAHGRGFGVVAQEIGKLALTSGSAAIEIQTLLDSSVATVGEIVETTKDRVVQAKQISEECDSMFRQMNDALGQINRAMLEMETVTQDHSNSSHEMTSQSALLAGESRTLITAVSKLTLVVSGRTQDDTPGGRSDSAGGGGAKPQEPLKPSAGVKSIPANMGEPAAVSEITRKDSRWKAA